ncbi:MAG: hypothetical protein ACFFCM_07785 [Promethearchaeota archaeon]
MANNSFHQPKFNVKNPLIELKPFSKQDFKFYSTDMNETSNFSSRNIVFDTSHFQVWSIWDTGFVGYSDLAILLRNNNFKVSASTNFLNETIPSLKKGDILVLNLGKYQTYTDQEITLIVQFVQQGGGVLVIGEHDNEWELATFQNKLLTNFNITINDDVVIDAYYYKFSNWITFNSSFFNLDNITFFAAASLTLGDGAISIAKASNFSTPIPNATVGARCEYGEGRVICVTDSEFIWNGDDGTGKSQGLGMKIGNNSKFALDIFKYLANISDNSNSINALPQYSLFTADSFLLNLTTNGVYNISTEIVGGSINPSQLINAGTWTTWNLTINNDGYLKFIVNNSEEVKTLNVYFLKPLNPMKSVLFLEWNFSRKADQSISGLFNFSKYLRDNNFSVFASESDLNTSNFDAICIANPLQNYTQNQINNLLNSKRLLVLGESYTNLAVNNIFNNMLTGFGFEPLWNPINSLLSFFDINLTHHLICDKSSNYRNSLIYPEIEGIIPELEFIAFQSTLLNTSNMGLEVFACGKSSSWGEGNSSLGYSNDAPLQFSAGDLTPTPLILYNSSIMVIGDTDIITNERNQTPIFPFLDCWLKIGNPYVDVGLTPSRENITANGTSTAFITSAKLNDSNGNALKNGTLITIKTDLGTIITLDEDFTTSGIQISIKNGILNFTLQSTTNLGIANISIYNFSFPVIGQTQIEFIDENPPISNHPDNITTDLYYFAYINWTLSDDLGPGYYRVLINGSPDCSWTPWTNNTSINYEINRSQAGLFYYIIEFNDSFGNLGDPDIVWITIIPDLPPQSTHPQNIITNTTGTEKIEWILWDDFAPGIYRVLINGSPDCSWTPWINNTAIFYDINRTQFGLYNYSIVFNDLYGNWGLTDSVMVQVLPDLPPTSNHPLNIITNSTDNKKIDWVLWDDYGEGFYRVFINGTPDNIWTGWYNDTPINYNINRNFSGIFNYTIVYNDSFGNYGNPDTVIIIIDFEPKSNSPPNITANIKGNEQIQWILWDDFGTGYYQVLLNSIPNCSWTPWNNYTSLNYTIPTNISGLYNYTIVFNDSRGNWGGDEVFLLVNFPPNTTQLDNITSYILGTEQINITLVDDLGAGQYRVWINGTPSIWQNWQNSTEINYDINRTEVGLFNYTFEYYDIYGLRGNPITLFINLWDYAPISNHPNNIIVLRSDSAFIHWILTDDVKNGSYRVYINGKPSEWIPWTNNTDIRFKINTKYVGTYNYTIIFSDDNGNYGIPDIVIIEVKLNIIDWYLLSNVGQSDNLGDLYLYIIVIGGVSIGFGLYLKSIVKNKPKEIISPVKKIYDEIRKIEEKTKKSEK